MQDFRNIEAWQLSRPFVVAVYRATRRFPPDERFGLTHQLRTSACAIGANIAEAFGRQTRRDAASVLQHAVSEGNETLHHLLTAFDLGYLSENELNELLMQLEPIRHKVLNLMIRIRPKTGVRGRSPRRSPAAEGRGSYPRA